MDHLVVLKIYPMSDESIENANQAQLIKEHQHRVGIRTHDTSKFYLRSQELIRPVMMPYWPPASLALQIPFFVDYIHDTKVVITPFQFSAAKTRFCTSLPILLIEDAAHIAC